VQSRTKQRALAAPVVVAALVAGCGGHGGASVRPAAERPRSLVVVIGDSLAAGRFADTRDAAFPQRVAAARHARLEVLAAPGVTTAALAAQAVPRGGNAVVVEAGTNDFLDQTPRRRFGRDYRALLAKVAAASPGAGLVCLTIWIAKDAAGPPPARIPASFYDATIRRACTAGAVVGISPLFARAGMRGPAGRPTFLGPADAFHPNSAGHAAIARAIEARL
jgi:acyl-CoA thioesterase I